MTMKRILIVAAALAMTAMSTMVACNNGLEPDDRGGDGGGTVTPSQPEEVSASWAALADSCTTALIENFMNKSTGTFWSTPRDVEKSSDYIYWQQAHAIDVVLYSYQRIKESNATLATTYAGYFQKWYEGGAHNYNTSHSSEGEYGRFYNDYTDDMAWICLTLIRFYEVFGVKKYADCAKSVFDSYIWPRATVGAKGLSLPWTCYDSDKENRNACTNSPSCLVAAKLYNIYKTSSYLTTAKTLYDFCIANMPDSERVEEPPLTYTQGTFGEACRQLYHITGESEYKEKAATVLAYAFRGNRCIDSATGVLRDEGSNMDQSLFKAVYVPYAVNFILDESMDKSTRTYLQERLTNCATHLSAVLDRSRYPQMYCNYSWVTPFTTGVASMGAEASGASLFEGMARLED